MLRQTRSAVLALAFLMLTAASLTCAAAPTAVDGVLAAAGPDLADGLALGGEWELYWGKLLSPEDFTHPERLPARRLIAVPGSWNAKGTGLPAYGVATYRLVVEMPNRAEQPFGLYLKGVGTAYRLFCNGALVMENGTVSGDLAEVRGTYAPRSAFFDAGGRLEIVLQVCNAEDNVAGLEETPILNRQASINAIASREILRDAIIYAIVLVMGLYHIILAMLHPAEKASLYFGFLSLDLGLRGMLTGARIIHQFAGGGIGFHALIAIEFITVYGAGLLAYLYFAHLFPQENPKFLFIPVLAASVGASILAAAAPITLTVTMHFYYEIFLLAEGVLIVVWIIRSLVKRRVGSLLMLAAFVVLLACAVYDIVLNMSHTGGLYITSYAMVFFILMQAVLIARRYALAYVVSQQQSRKAEGLATAYGRFVPREFLGLLGKDSIENVNLGDQIQLNLAVLFSDIRSFTTLSENMSPKENFNFLNSYLNRISPVVRRNRGFIDKYLGDGIMALFPRSPLDAVRAGLELMETVRVFNGHRANCGYRPIDIGVGINTGSLMLGTIGESSRMEGTVISDAVNLASRLEGLTRSFGTHIIVSEDLLTACPDAETTIPHRYLGRARVKGKAQEVTIYEIIDGPDAVRVETRALFEEALRHFEARRYAQAAAGFRAVLARDAADTAALYYLRRIVEDLRKARRPRQS
jgi:adenylate cyclase